MLVDPKGARYSFIGNQLRCTNRCSTRDVSVKKEPRTGPWILHGKHNSKKCPYTHGLGSTPEWTIGKELQSELDSALAEIKKEDLNKNMEKKKKR